MCKIQLLFVYWLSICIKYHTKLISEQRIGKVSFCFNNIHEFSYYQNKKCFSIDKSITIHRQLHILSLYLNIYNYIHFSYFSYWSISIYWKMLELLSTSYKNWNFNISLHRIINGNNMNSNGLKTFFSTN